MPRFFFDFRQGEDHSPDIEGLELASTEDAYLEAVKGAQEMWSELLKKRRDPHHCRFEVRDINGALLFHLPFEEVLENCLDRKPVKPAAGADHAAAAATATAGRAKRANDDFQRTLSKMRTTLAESRALLTPKG